MSGKVRDYTRLAKDILEAVGGEENVIGASSLRYQTSIDAEAVYP
ncbi:hypothetical protein [Bacillus subtilis]